MQNDQGKGVSHATGESKVPQKVQEKVPAGFEKGLPDSIHDTSTGGAGTADKNVTHAKGGGADSKVPIGIQKAVPEKLERALPDSIHNTGDSKK